jgi:hypothetical protein
MRPNRLCCVLSTAALALCVAVSSAETTEAKEVSSHSTAADSATLCVEFVERPVASCVDTDDQRTITPPQKDIPRPEMHAETRWNTYTLLWLHYRRKWLLWCMQKGGL